MALVADAGALIALDRGDRTVAARIEVARRRGMQVVTSSACVAQVWRDGARQSELARTLRAMDERALDQDSSRRVGELCARAGTGDVVDAHLATLARPGDVVVTSDPDDLTTLLRVLRVKASVVRC